MHSLSLLASNRLPGGADRDESIGGSRAFLKVAFSHQEFLRAYRIPVDQGG